MAREARHVDSTRASRKRRLGSVVLRISSKSYGNEDEVRMLQFFFLCSGATAAETHARSSHCVCDKSHRTAHLFVTECLIHTYARQRPAQCNATIAPIVRNATTAAGPKESRVWMGVPGVSAVQASRHSGPRPKEATAGPRRQPRRRSGQREQIW